MKSVFITFIFTFSLIFNSFSQNNVSKIRASSTLPNSKDPDRYAVTNLMDNDLKTAWVEGAKGLGEEEFIEWTFQNETEIEGLIIAPGYMRSPEVFVNNAVPTKFNLAINGKYYDSYAIPYEHYYADDPKLPGYRFSDDTINQNLRVILFPSPVKAKQVKLIIKKGFYGKKYQDLCISEIQ